MRRTVFNEASTIGALATSRTGLDGSYNVAYGLDADVRLDGTDYLVAKWAQTVDEEVIRQYGRPARPRRSPSTLAFATI